MEWQPWRLVNAYIRWYRFIVPYQFEPESDDKTVEVADQQETDSS